MAIDKTRTVGRNKGEARLLKLKFYHGPECRVHAGSFTRYTSNGACVLCRRLQDDVKGKSRGYIAKRGDADAFNHPVSPWPVTAENMHRCPDISCKHT